jgi:hypothetical protein
VRKSFYAVLPLIFVLTATTARAQTNESLDEINNELGADNFDETVEAPPRPEPPYPGSEDIDAVTPPPRAQSAEPAVPTGDTWATKLAPTPAPVPLPGVQRPSKIDENGNYFYGTDTTPSETVRREGIARPTEKGKGGDYVYDINDKSTTPKRVVRPNIERPIEITAKGEFNYKLPEKKSNRTSSFRVGIMTPPTIKNEKVPTATFQSIYKGEYQPVLLGDYEWRLTSKIGRLGLKFTSGLFVASGTGVFVTPRPEGTPAEEKMNFFMFPNQFTAIYRFQYSDNQIFVPFAEGGGAYYTFAEVRDDSKPPKFGGAAGLVGAGGLNILLDWADRRGIQRLNSEYGIAHVWLTMEGRVTVGMISEVDVSSQAYTAGFMLDF